MVCLISCLPWVSSFSITILIVFANIADIIQPHVMWVLLVGDAMAKISVNEGARHIDACRLERRFSGVPSVGGFRESLVQVTVTSMLRLCATLVNAFVNARGSGAFRNAAAVVFLSSQLFIGVTMFISGWCLIIATTPPQESALPVHVNSHEENVQPAEVWK